MLKMILLGIKQMLKGLIALPGDLARAVLGRNGLTLPPPETPYEDEVERQAAKLRQELIELPAEAAKAASTLGQRVHAYAAGDRAQRDGFDFGSVPEHVAVALLTMQPHQLLRLAAAGPEACGRWAEGGRTGLVGVPPCERTGSAGMHQTEMGCLLLPALLKPNPHRFPGCVQHWQPDFPNDVV
jgi:hypothetical protein